MLRLTHFPVKATTWGLGTDLRYYEPTANATFKVVWRLEWNRTLMLRPCPPPCPAGRRILYYAMLCYAVLYYAILYYTMLYCTMLCYAMLCYTILYYTILYYTILYYTILYYIIIVV